MLTIEISYTTEEDDFPEHYGYYHNIEDAKEALDNIKKAIEEEE